MSYRSQGINPIENKMRTKEKQMIVGNAEYFETLNRKIKEKQNDLSLSNSKVVAMKQMIADRDKEIEDLKEQLKTALEDKERNDRMWMNENNESMILRRRIVKLGFNPTVGSRMFVESFQSLYDDPIDEELVEIYNDPIYKD